MSLKNFHLHTEDSELEKSVGNEKHPNIFKQIKKIETRENIYKLTEILGTLSSLLGNQRCVILWGYGEQMKSTYRKLKYVEGINVIWHGSCLPGLLKPLGYFLASEMGLIQILNNKNLAPVFDILGDLAIVELFSFPQNLLIQVIEHAKQNGRNGYPADIVFENNSFFCFGIMGDSQTSSTGYKFWVSHGEECPSDLKKFVKEMVE